MIYVLGSINIDMVASVPYMPKSGETLRATAFMTGLGGKGANQAAAVARLGGFPVMLGAVGSDENGQFLLKRLDELGVDSKRIKVADGPSGTAFITVVNGDNRIIIFGGANLALSAKNVDEGLKDAEKGDILLTQLEIPLEITAYALKVAKQKGMITVLNPAPAAPIGDDAYRYVDVIAPNETETELLTGVNPTDDAHTALAVKYFYGKGVKNVVITLGSRGSAVSHGMEITPIPARKVKAVDTTAAGDTFIGAAALCLGEGRDIVSACRFATVAASIKVTRPGAAAAIPTTAEVRRVIEEEGIAGC